MPEHLICPRGHSWTPTDREAVGDGSAGPICPICNSTGAIKPVEAVTDNWQTLYPGQSSSTSPDSSRGEPSTAAPGNTTIAPTSTSPPGPTTFGPAATSAIAGFEVLSVLGRGAMGVVYKARQLSLNRIVALKTILSGIHASPQERARFLTEAEAVATLQHPSIIQIYAVGEHDGMPFYSMEIIEGGSLESKIKGGRLSPPDAASLMEKLARAMHYAHQRGVVHRDLKPANILLTPEGEPKITDFGLAKRIENDPNRTDARYVTQSGAAIGTPSYMSPEQAEGKRVGPLADVYSLGAVLYELLTGRPPFVAETVIETLQLVVKEEPPAPSRLQPHLPRDLVTICLKCLRKQPEQRYGTAGEFADDLRCFLEGRPIQAVPVGNWERVVKWVKRRPAAAALLGVIVCVLLGLAVEVVVYHARVKRDLRNTTQLLQELYLQGGMDLVDAGHQTSALPFLVEALRLGNELHVDDRMHRLRLALVLRDCPRTLRCWFHEGPVNDATFSPNGQLVVTAGDDNLACVWDVTSWNLIGTPLRHGGAVLQASFCTDGKRVLSASEDGTARVWEVHSGREICRSPLHGGVVVAASFSTDGQRFCTASADGTTRVCDANTGRELIRPLQHPGPVRHATFSPDDQMILTVADQEARLWHAGTGMPAGPKSGLRHDGKQVLTAAFNKDATLVVTGGEDNQARQWNVATGLQLSTMRHNGAVLFACFSPDENVVATASVDGSARVWKASSGEKIGANLTHRDRVVHVAFSPDSRHLATSGGDNSAFVWEVASGDPLTQRLRSNGNINKVRFSPNGRYVLTASEAGVARLWQPGRAVNRPWPMATVPVPSANARSPDDRWEVASDDGVTLQLRDLRTGEPIGPAFRPGGRIYTAVFSLDGRRLLLGGSDGKAHLWDTESCRRLPDVSLVHASTVVCATFSPNGKFVATGSSDNTGRVWNVATGEPTGRFLKHHSTVDRILFSPNGELLLTASANGSAHLFDATSGQRLSPALDPHDWVKALFNSPDDPAVWKLPHDGRPVEELEVEAEWLSGQHIDRKTRRLSPYSDMSYHTLQERIRLNYPDLVFLAP